MKISGLLTLLLVLSLPLAAQEVRRDARPPLPGPVEVLLTNRAELGLTPEQVVRLEQIEQEMEAASREPLLRLLELRKQGRQVRARSGAGQGELTDDQRAELRALMDEARPLLAQIGANNREAMAKVGAVLTAEQKTQLRSLLRERMDRHGKRGRSPDRSGGPF